MINEQKHQTTCGIVAIKNALEFKDKKRKMDRYENLLKYSIRNMGFLHDGNGMWPVQIRWALKMKRIRFKNTVHPTFADISHELSLGRGIILAFRHFYKGVSHGHFAFIDKETPTQFRMWNHTAGCSEWIKKKDLARDMRYSFRHHAHAYPHAIVIL